MGRLPSATTTSLSKNKTLLLISYEHKTVCDLTFEIMLLQQKKENIFQRKYQRGTEQTNSFWYFNLVFFPFETDSFENVTFYRSIVFKGFSLGTGKAINAQCPVPGNHPHLHHSGLRWYRSRRTEWGLAFFPSLWPSASRTEDGCGFGWNTECVLVEGVSKIKYWRRGRACSSPCCVHVRTQNAHTRRLVLSFFLQKTKHTTNQKTIFRLFNGM